MKWENRFKTHKKKAAENMSIACLLGSFAENDNYHENTVWRWTAFLNSKRQMKKKHQQHTLIRFDFFKIINWFLLLLLRLFIDVNVRRIKINRLIRWFILPTNFRSSASIYKSLNVKFWIKTNFFFCQNSNLTTCSSSLIYEERKSTWTIWKC